MATIRERQNKDGTTRFQAKVRLLGTPEINRTFPSRKDAERWAMSREEALINQRCRQAEGSRSWPVHMAGIYLLWKGPDLIYVGHSNDVLTRVVSHVKNKKDFDHWSFKPCLAEEMLSVERQWIEKYQPRLNINGRKHATVENNNA
jgi:hypothetical protein